MAFKPRSTQSVVLSDPVQLFRSLPLRKIETENPHQQEVLLKYAADLAEKKDLAIQLPTGSGKTLVGLMIAEWRRRKFSERVVYLCPTKQLVHQTVRQANTVYGLEVKGFVGSNKEFNQADVARYRSGECIAITTYSAVFNSNPFFDDAHLLVLDDAHTVENYIAKNWSIEISASVEEQKSLFGLVSSLIGTHISRYDFAMLQNKVKPDISRGWLNLLTIDKVVAIENELSDLLDEHAEGARLNFAWSMLRGHLAACNIFLAPGQILIRPYVPPTWSSRAFCNPARRIYLSATLGEGGDLERLTGRRTIDRLKAPKGLEAHGVGRRFFIFPSRSLDDDKAGALIASLIKETPRAVFLTTSSRRATDIEAWVKEKCKYQVFTSDDIETSKDAFVASTKAVAVLAGRFDGIDFPKDESRLLLIDDVPSMVNLQEQFVSKQLGAVALFRDRVKTRVLQALGRCTRSFVDTSAVVVTGVELRDYLMDADLKKELHPELQAEIDFGDYQSTDVNPDDLLRYFRSFLALDKDWQSANNEITNSAAGLSQSIPAYLSQLQGSVRHEVQFSEALWRGDYPEAYQHALDVLGSLTDAKLKGLRAFWSYMAGVAAYLEARHTSSYRQKALDQFSVASKASEISWLGSLRRISGDSQAEAGTNEDDNFQCARMASNFAKYGVVNNSKFNKAIMAVQAGLDDLTKFEPSQVALGELLGFVSENSSDSAAPDPWWRSRHKGMVFEDYAEAQAGSCLSPTKAKQALGHVNWLRYNRPELKDVDFVTVIVTPVTKIYKGALPQISGSYVWPLADYVKWSNKSLLVIRELKASFTNEDDLVWRAECLAKLSAANLTIEGIIGHIKKVDVSGAMDVIDGSSDEVIE